ncbi:hypothetical protein HX824_25975 [Pseudomonas sp. D4002]|uniref:hypothetical protein n=1 Tax=Pseudomonas sp. D4002 TaxID=2738817 RepID=UPI0015A3FE4D|nr:hypothetical protein [Pseudomonas sp. D4002]NWB24079.1 hypothetical protein [Pseudomonas sp. D4002]
MAEAGLVKLWAALWRILAGEPLTVSRDDYLSYDLVCLEAGFKRGYLKANRKQHEEIRARISENMAVCAAKPKKATQYSLREVSRKKNEEIKEWKKKYESALNREILLIDYISKLEQQLELRKKPRLIYSNSPS